MQREAASLAFKALSDPTRLRMVRLLASNDVEMCVCEFVDVLQERQYNVSRQLKSLASAGLVRGEKEGRWTYFGLLGRDDPAVSSLCRLVAELPADELFLEDQRRFEERARLRTGGRCQVGIQTPSLAGDATTRFCACY